MLKIYESFCHIERWIGRGGPIPWPPRSPDLNSLDFFFWGYLKETVYPEQNIQKYVCLEVGGNLLEHILRQF